MLHCLRLAGIALPKTILRTSKIHQPLVVSQWITGQSRHFALPSQWGTRKGNRIVSATATSLNNQPQSSHIDANQLKAAIQKQGDHVRNLKSTRDTSPDGKAAQIASAVAELKTLKSMLLEWEQRQHDVNGTRETDTTSKHTPSTAFDRFRHEDLLRRRFYYDQSFAIYGGVSGQYDFGPLGSALLANLLTEWRRFFVHADRMLEIECAVLTPEPVLRASGHLERFVDWMVSDMVSGECFRLDHLVKQHLEKELAAEPSNAEHRRMCEGIIDMLDGLDRDELYGLLVTHDIRSPTTGNQLSEPKDFNLMFRTDVGNDSGDGRRYLRPETAQGVFVNYGRLLADNGGRLPFAAAQIGSAFRNEIAPRSGLLRLREFTMAEIEHFCAPGDRRHKKFGEVRDVVLRLYAACAQMDGVAAEDVRAGDAVKMGLIANETLGYYLARIQQFLIGIGIREDRLRFRQHMSNEMAHYASDCWDAEILTSYGWIECVGCADRSAYDLNQHNRATSESNTTPSAAPDVIEPSFGIGRILSALLEHSFRQRPDDEQRIFLALPPLVAPIKCVVLPLNSNAFALRQICSQIGASLTERRVVHKEDMSAGSIGRRYARSDEIGTPYALTVDFETAAKGSDGSVTLRDRDTMQQVRVPVGQVAEVVQRLAGGRLSWKRLKECLDAEKGFVGGGETPTNYPEMPPSEFQYTDSFAMYGPRPGQQDLGPAGCALKRRIADAWSDVFIVQDKALMMQCSVLTPETVLGDLSASESSRLLRTPIGPAGTMAASLRADLSTGILVNFKRLLEYNSGKLPFAVAQSGRVYRNESTVRSDLMRSYEFDVHELVYFCDAKSLSDGQCEGFESVRGRKLTVLLDDGGCVEWDVGDLVEKGIISSQTLAYLLSRVRDFLHEIGVESNRIRFRRQAPNSSNLFTDGWDVDIFIDSVYTKCGSLVDRSTHALRRHSLATGVRLTAERTLESPRQVSVLQAKTDRTAMRKMYKKAAKTICEQLDQMEQTELLRMKTTIDAGEVYSLAGDDGGNFQLTKKLVDVETVTKMLHVEEIEPNCVHVVFGVGRLMKAVLATEGNSTG